MSLLCWNCGNNLDDTPRPISRHATCGRCFNELHCCRLCRHYDEKRSLQCFEDRAEPPLQKENANFCEFFSPRADAFENTTADRSAGARSELDALFGPAAPAEQADADANDAPPASEADQARRKLDDLFN